MSPGWGFCPVFPVDIQPSYCYNNPVGCHTAGRSRPHIVLIHEKGNEKAFRLVISPRGYSMLLSEDCESLFIARGLDIPLGYGCTQRSCLGCDQEEYILPYDEVLSLNKQLVRKKFRCFQR